MSMAKANSQMFYRTILLLSFVTFAISLKTATKQDKYVLGGKKTDKSSAEWLEPVEERASKKMAAAEYVYIMTMEDAPEIKVKIGYSNDPAYRRTQLQVGNPWKLVVLNQYQVTDMEEAEKDAKYAMRSHWFRGEWYNLPPGGIASVRRIVSTAIGPYKVGDDIPRKNV